MWNGVRCGLWLCDVELLCFEMWWCEMVVGGRLRCNVNMVVRGEMGCDIKCLRDMD